MGREGAEHRVLTEMKRINVVIWAGIVLTILVQVAVFCFEFWVNTSGLVPNTTGQGRLISVAQLLRTFAYGAGFPAGQPIVLSAVGRLLLGIVSFAVGAIWMWLKSAGGAQPEEQ